MKVAYFDCFSGAGGDMIVAALLDAGLELEALRGGLARLRLPGLEVSAEKVRRGGLAAVKFNVSAGEPDPPHRRLGEILAMIAGADLPGQSGPTAERIFRRLAAAEAKVHGCGVEEVHFHEIGAADSIADIVGAAVAIELLGVRQVLCSPIPLGSGTIRTAHGVLPVPAPATAELLRGAAVAETPEGAAGELTTPTAAAVLTTLAEAFGPVPAMDLEAVGCGAGTRDGSALPNVLRVLIGRSSEAGEVDSAVELSVNLDDCTGQVMGATIERLLAAGCADAWAAPIYMKKSRPAWTLSALCSPGQVAAAEGILFAETTTLGVRRRTCSRSRLSRRHVTVETPYGPIRVKVGQRGGRVLTAAPEFADCAAAAESHHAAVKEVIAAAADAYRRQHPPSQKEPLHP